jgi:hypothetical protein
MTLTKVCRECKRTLPIGNFGPRRPQCRECYNTRYSKANTLTNIKFRKDNIKAQEYQRIKRAEINSRPGAKEKLEARCLMSRAIEKGILVKPANCEHCSKEINRLEGHHKDYSKPLDIVWLCRSCHNNVHLGNITLAEEPI